MTQPHARATGTLLENIARKAMPDLGLLPDFSQAVAAETKAITAAAVDSDPSIVDLRDMLWASIDNDDSRDLDRLDVGDRLRVRLVSTNVERGFIDFARAEAR